MAKIVVKNSDGTIVESNEFGLGHDPTKLDKSGGEMTGLLKLANDGLRSGNEEYGVQVDRYLNFHALNNANTWGVFNQQNEQVFQVAYQTKKVRVNGELEEQGKRVFSPNNPQEPFYSNDEFVLDDGADLNDYKEPGIWVSPLSSYTISNKPTGASSAGKLVVYNTTNSNLYVNQEWINVIGAKKWIRNYNSEGGGSWSGWEAISGDSSGGVTGVKGNAETTYRAGNVNLTPENIGAVNKAGDVVTGRLYLDAGADIRNGNSNTYLELGKVGNTGIEFHCQSDESKWCDFDAYIQANSPNSSSSSGSAVLNYNAREHNFNSTVNMGGALNLANATWNVSGDDAYFGDNNRAGAFCIKGANGPTALELFAKNDNTNSVRMEYNGNNLFFNKPIVSKHTNDFISNNNEFNFLPQGYNNDVLVNYRGGNVTAYYFLKGTDGRSALAPVYAGNIYDNSSRVYSANNKPPLPTSTGYYHLMGGGWKNAGSYTTLYSRTGLSTGLVTLSRDMDALHSNGYTYYLFELKNNSNEWIQTLIPYDIVRYSSSSQPIFLNGGSTPNTARWLLIYKNSNTAFYIQNFTNIRTINICMVQI